MTICQFEIPKSKLSVIDLLSQGIKKAFAPVKKRFAAPGVGNVGGGGGFGGDFVIIAP